MFSSLLPSRESPQAQRADGVAFLPLPALSYAPSSCSRGDLCTGEPSAPCPPLRPALATLPPPGGPHPSLAERGRPRRGPGGGSSGPAGCCAGSAGRKGPLRAGQGPRRTGTGRPRGPPGLTWLPPSPWPPPEVPAAAHAPQPRPGGRRAFCQTVQ